MRVGEPVAFDRVWDSGGELVALSQAPKVWTLKIGGDLASGQKIVTATAEACVSGPASPIYRLTLTFVGRSQDHHHRHVRCGWSHASTPGLAHDRVGDRNHLSRDP
jgi:hypothetical protein